MKAGDDVIVPNYTMIATSNSVCMFGANPIFVDVEPETLCLEIEKTKAALTRKTRAIMLVTANGRYPKVGIEKFVDLADEHGLCLIEDAAQSLGSQFPDGRHMGRAGKVGSFSFSVPKVITTGQGGCLITDDDDVAERLRQPQGFRPRNRRNGHPSQHRLQFQIYRSAGLCRHRANEKARLENRAQEAGFVKLSGRRSTRVKDVKFFEQDLDNTTPWFIDVLCERRDELQVHLKDRGIGTRAMYPPDQQSKGLSAGGFLSGF